MELESSQKPDHVSTSSSSSPTKRGNVNSQQKKGNTAGEPGSEDTFTKHAFKNNWGKCFKPSDTVDNCDAAVSLSNSGAVVIEPVPRVSRENERRAVNTPVKVSPIKFIDDKCYATWADSDAEDQLPPTDASMTTWADIEPVQQAHPPPPSILSRTDSEQSIVTHYDNDSKISILPELDGVSMESLIEMINDLSSHIAHDLLPFSKTNRKR